MNYRIVHDEWFLDKDITKLDAEVYSFLLVKLAKKHSYLRKTNHHDTLFYNQIETSVADILSKTSLDGDEKRMRRVVRESLRKLEKKNFLVLNSPTGKNRTTPNLPFMVEVLWSAKDARFVPRETKNGETKRLNVSKNDTFIAAKCVEKRHISDLNVSKNDTYNAKCVEKRHIYFQNNGKNKAKIAKSAVLIDIIENNMEISSNKLPEENRLVEDDPFTGIDPTTYFSIEGIRGAYHHASFISELNSLIRESDGQDVSQFLLETKNIANVLAPELRSSDLFRFSTPLSDENQINYTTHDPVRVKNDFFRLDLYPSLQEAFIGYLRDYPRGIFWSKDSGAPWAGPRIPFFYFQSSKEYFAQPGFSRNSPFPRMTDIHAMQQIMSFDFMIPHPTQEGTKIPLYKVYSAPAKMMFWLMATTGLSSESIREQYKYYVSQVLNPTTVWAKSYAKTPKIGHDWLVNFRDFLVGCSFTNRFVSFQKNEGNQFMLKFPGDEVWETQPFFGSIFWHVGKNGKRQEVYVTSYQNDYRQNNPVPDFHTVELDKKA